MADTVAQASLMPLSGEINLANYISNLFGGGAKLGNLSLASVPTLPTTAGVEEYTPEQLNQLMTEWLRGAGNFTGTAREQNLSGLYNTATRNLLSNDLLAQAALKATQANVPIKTANAQIAQTQANAQAQLAANVALANAKSQNEYNMEAAKLKASQPSAGVLGGALGIAALSAILNKTTTGEKVKKGTSNILDSIFGAPTQDKTGTSGTSVQQAQLPEMGMEEMTNILSSIPGEWRQSYADIPEFDAAAYQSAFDSFTPTQAASDFANSQFADLSSTMDFGNLNQWAGWAPSYSGYAEGTGYGTSIANYDLPNIGGGYDFAWDTTQPTYDLADAGDCLNNFADNIFSGGNFGFSWG